MARTRRVLCRDPRQLVPHNPGDHPAGLRSGAQPDIVGDDWTLIGATREAQGKAAEKDQTEHFDC